MHAHTSRALRMYTSPCHDCRLCRRKIVQVVFGCSCQVVWSGLFVRSHGGVGWGDCGGGSGGGCLRGWWSCGM